LTYKTRHNRKTEKITQQIQNEGQLDDHIKKDEIGGIVAGMGKSNINRIGRVFSQAQHT
jgi:hypothetical protein